MTPRPRRPAGPPRPERGSRRPAPRPARARPTARASSSRVSSTASPAAATGCTPDRSGMASTCWRASGSSRRCDRSAGSWRSTSIRGPERGTRPRCAASARRTPTRCARRSGGVEPSCATTPTPRDSSTRCGPRATRRRTSRCVRAIRCCSRGPCASGGSPSRLRPRTAPGSSSTSTGPAASCATTRRSRCGSPTWGRAVSSRSRSDRRRRACAASAAPISPSCAAGRRPSSVSRLRRILREGPLTLLTGVRELDASYAAILAHALSRGKTPRI